MSFQQVQANNLLRTLPRAISGATLFIGQQAQIFASYQWQTLFPSASQYLITEGIAAAATHTYIPPVVQTITPAYSYWRRFSTQHPNTASHIRKFAYQAAPRLVIGGMGQVERIGGAISRRFSSSTDSDYGPGRQPDYQLYLETIDSSWEKSMHTHWSTVDTIIPGHNLVDVAQQGKIIQYSVGFDELPLTNMIVPGHFASRMMDIHAHGNHRTIQIFDEHMFPNEFASFLRQDGLFQQAYNELGSEMIIRLLVCDAGTGTSCFAEKISPILGVKVLAPAGLLYLEGPKAGKGVGLGIVDSEGSAYTNPDLHWKLVLP